MAAEAGRIKRGRKFDQVVSGAREVFLRCGFEGASVDDIARAAGVSKATLYSYFPDKRLLFSEVTAAECCRQVSAAVADIDPDLPPDAVLREAAERMMCFALSDFGRAAFRIVIGEAERFPELGRAFWANGPGRSRDGLVAYFAHAEARGEVRIDDPELAAEQFLELCRAGILMRRLMGVEVDISDAERARVIDAAVEMFLARYGT